MIRLDDNFEDEKMAADIFSRMNADKREDVFKKIAPCSDEDFIKTYLDLDPDFEKILNDEFGVEIY